MLYSNTSKKLLIVFSIFTISYIHSNLETNELISMPKPSSVKNQELDASLKAKPHNPKSGGNLTYKVKIFNKSKDAIKHIVITDVIPKDTTFVSAHAPKEHWKTHTPNPGHTGMVMFTCEEFKPHTEVKLKIVVKIDDLVHVGKEICNEVIILNGSHYPDPSKIILKNEVKVGLSLNNIINGIIGFFAKYFKD